MTGRTPSDNSVSGIDCQHEHRKSHLPMCAYIARRLRNSSSTSSNNRRSTTDNANHKGIQAICSEERSFPTSTATVW